MTTSQTRNADAVGRDAMTDEAVIIYRHLTPENRRLLLNMLRQMVEAQQAQEGQETQEENNVAEVAAIFAHTAKIVKDAVDASARVVGMAISKNAVATVPDVKHDPSDDDAALPLLAAVADGNT